MFSILKSATQKGRDAVQVDFSAVNIIGTAAALAAGAALSAGNCFLTLRVWKKDPGKLPSLFALRQFLNIVFLVAVWFVTPLTPCDRTWVLIGAAIGLTLPTLILTPRIMRTPHDPACKDDTGSDQDKEKKGGKDQ